MTYLLPTLLCCVLLAGCRYLTPPRRRERLLKQEPFTPATWGLIELLGIFLVYAACVSVSLPLGQALFGWSFPPTDSYHAAAVASAPIYSVSDALMATASLLTAQATTTACALVAEERKLWLIGCSTLFAVLLGSVLLAATTRARVGWTLAAFPRDAKLALLAITLCLPVVFLVQAIVVQIPGMEYQHPLLELLLDTPSPRLWLALSFSAVLVAPLHEEFFFRGLLQGWIEKLLRRPHQTKPTTDESNLAVSPSVPLASSSLPVWVPILVSSILFAAAHFNHGGGWIAIFVLSLGLGLLYHKTHRLLPCILLHMALNAASLALAYYSSLVN